MLERTVAVNPLIPHVPTARQIRFLELECLDALYGGAAGGGKSDALLMAALQFAEVPGYAALLLRRTFADLKLPGALIDRSREWLSGKAHWNAQEHRWRFPSGSTLQFGYADHDGDEERYRSSEFQFIGLDEATQFTERQTRFLFSRLRRRRTIPVPLRYRLGTNPGGPGHDFIKRRYIKPGTPGKVFVPARLTDNPHLDQQQYVKSLAEVDSITRAQLLTGDWDAVAGGRFRREWFDGRYTTRGDYLVLRRHDEASAYEVHAGRCDRFGTVDPAASAKTTADYTAAGVWLVTPRNDLVWWDCERFQASPPDIVPRLEQIYQRHRLSRIGIEAVAANNAVYEFAKRTRMVVARLNPMSQDKLVRATPAMVLAESRRVWLPAPGVRPGFPLEDVESELLRFTGDDKIDDHDDLVDCLSYSVRMFDSRAGADPRYERPVILGG